MNAVATCHSAFRKLGDHRLFVVEHVPQQRRGTVLLVSPFLEEMVFCRRLLRNLAIQLADQGWQVLRFDGYGEGDSEGELANADVAGALADIAALGQSLRQEADGPVLVIGWRWGANLAISAAADFDAVIAVEPLESGEEYVQQMLRQNLTSQMAAWGKVRLNREQLLQQSEQQKSINVQGFELGPGLISQMRNWTWPQQLSAPLAIIRSQMPAVAAVSERWKHRARALGATLTELDNRPYWFEPRFHQPDLPIVLDAVRAATTQLLAERIK